MTRRGFALLTVLWLIAGLGAITAASLALARVGAGVSRNRILLIRAAWARNACEEILLARYAERRTMPPLDSTDLGGGAWCTAIVEEAGTRLDLNRAAPEALRQLLGNDSLADPRNGPFADPAELRWVRGFDSATVQQLGPLLTTSGEFTVDLNAAPAAVLASLPGLDAQAVAIILGRRASVPFQSTDELLALLSDQSRATLLNRYQEFAGHAAYGRSAAYGPGRVVLRVRGAAGRPALVAGERLTVIPVPGRLAVIRREIR